MPNLSITNEKFASGGTDCEPNCGRVSLWLSFHTEQGESVESPNFELPKPGGIVIHNYNPT